MKQRIEWLAVLRGFNILLVVMVHIQLVDMSTGTNHLFCSAVAFPFHPIRMPLFIFISGGLLYLSRIRKNISTKALYKDKFQRIMIPFFFFVIAYYILKIVFNEFAKTPTELSLSYFLQSFIYFRGFPSQPLWFLAVLMMFMLMYPLFCYLCDNKYRMACFFLFCSAIYFIDSNLDSPYNVFYVLDIQHYLVYFFFGILFFRYELYNYVKSTGALLILILLYVVSYYYSIDLLTSIVGIMMMCSLCLKIAQYLPNLFSSFREYIFQIYLMSLPFQTFVELILWKNVFYYEEFFYLFYAINLLAGLFMPVLIAKLVERCHVKMIRLCFGLQ
jgi:fucose 4-O-acetylase-like acetyltransferase